MSNTSKRKGIPDGIKTLPQLVAFFGVARACRRVPALVGRKPIVLGLVIPKGQADLYKRVAGIIVESRKFRLDGDASVIVVDTDPRRRAKNEGDIWDAVRDYDRVVVIAERRDYLPSRFQMLADAVVETSPISARDIVSAVRILFFRDMKLADAEIAAAASLDVLAGAFRKGRPIAVSMRVLRAAMAVTDDTSRDLGPTLDDLHGLGEAGAWGRDLAIDLADWKAGILPWSDVERGILLSGPPGTGKTTFASALARTCGVYFVAESVAKWQSKGHLGDLLKAMYGAFEEAKSHAPAILFLDEIDAVGDRERFSGDNSQYCTEVVNGLLECLDGAGGREGVVIVGACNHPGRLDAAIVRPGRLDRHVVIPLPDALGREGIIRWHLQGALEDDDLTHVVERTEGASGAALEQLVRQARRSARRARRDMRLGDIAEELPALIPVPSASLWRTAVHEAGHATAGLSVFGNRWKIFSASVLRVMTHTGPQKAGGVAWEDFGEYTATAADYRSRIVRVMGGLAAEEVFFGERTDGGGGIKGSDLHSATVTATAMEASMGLGSAFAFLSTADGDELMHLLQYDSVLRSRVEKTLAECFQIAKKLVGERRADVERLAHALVDKGSLSGAEIQEILDAQPKLKLVSPS